MSEWLKPFQRLAIPILAKPIGPWPLAAAPVSAWISTGPYHQCHPVRYDSQATLGRRQLALLASICSLIGSGRPMAGEILGRAGRTPLESRSSWLALVFIQCSSLVIDNTIKRTS